MDTQDNEHERLLARIATPVGKYWICKRTPNHAYEAMEVIGGSGVMDTHITARLFRESPINAIWEGSGNVQCLDILRAIEKEPAVLEAYFTEVAKAQGENKALDAYVRRLAAEFAGQQSASDMQYKARNIADRMAVALQASLLIQHAPEAVSDAFCASRLQPGLNYGNLPSGVDCQAIIERGQRQ